MTHPIFRHKKPNQKILLTSDWHLDNPDCNKALLEKHLKKACEQDAKIRVIGDLLCVMQGLSDKRGNKTKIMPELKGSDYFNRVIDYAYAFMKPYAKNIDFISYGNHETAIIKRQEIDLLKILVTRLNSLKNVNITLGMYGGFIKDVLQYSKKGSKCGFVTKYFHGSGGGGIVTKGVIQNQRIQNYVHGADLYWMGHVHEFYHLVNTVEQPFLKADNTLETRLKNVHHIRTPTYKDEYKDGGFGWHIERGAPPKPLGAFMMDLKIKNNAIAPSFEQWGD